MICGSYRLGAGSHALVTVLLSAIGLLSSLRLCLGAARYAVITYEA